MDDSCRKGPDGILCTMLGTNDVPAAVSLGEPEIADEMLSRYYEESCRMNLTFEALCAEYGVRFADAAKWGVEMCFDYIHFSKDGHRTFAEGMMRVLEFLYVRNR